MSPRLAPASFFSAALPWARSASSATGVHTSVILAQWADEQGWIWPPMFNNPGNVGDPSNAGQTGYPTLTAGVDAYIRTMLLPFYTSVRAPVSANMQGTALGYSPWAAGHYGSPPGSTLLALISQYNLTQYDGAAPGPPSPTPAPVPQEVQPMTSVELSNGKVLIAGVGANNRADHLLVFIFDPADTTAVVPVTDVSDGLAGEPGAPYLVAS